MLWKDLERCPKVCIRSDWWNLPTTNPIDWLVKHYKELPMFKCESDPKDLPLDDPDAGEPEKEEDEKDDEEEEE